MKSSLRNALLAAALLAPALLVQAPARAANVDVLPGYWVSDNSLDLLIRESSTTRKCLTADQVREWITGPSNRHYTCVYDKRSVGDGHVSLGGSCHDRKGRTLTVDITGAYAPEHFHLVAHFHYLLMGIPFPGVGETDAHRISATCPADLPPGK